MKRLKSGLAALLLGGLALQGACLPTGPTDQENPAAPVSALDDPTHPGLEACTNAQVESELQLAVDFKDSCHEMVICGGLSMAFVTTLVSVLFNSASGNATDADGFRYVGEGRYAAGSQMELTLTLGQDTSFGKVGDVIDFDVFLLANYFEKASITAKASVDTSGNATTTVSATYEGAQNGAELLGLEAGGSGQLKLDLNEIADALSQHVLIETRILMQDARDSSTVRYQLYAPPTRLGVYFANGPMDMQLVDVAASSSTGQTLTVSNWAMEYKTVSGGGTLDGQIDFEVRGGSFDYAARFVYPHRKEPDVTLSCL